MRHLDHVNFLAVDPGENRAFLEQNLGLRLTEQIVLDDGTEAGVWLASNQKSYDLTYTRDLTQTRPAACTTSRSSSTSARTCCAPPTSSSSTGS